MVATANEVHLTDKMHRFITDDEARYLLFSGGRDCLKSTSLVYKLVARASVPGAREGLCRHHLTTLKASTLLLLTEGSGSVPAALPPGSYTWNKVEQTIKIKGGGTIYYFGLDDPNRARSMNLTGCAVEEWSEITENELMLLDGSIRAPCKALRRQVYGATNPSTSTHYLAQRFGLAPGKTSPEPNHTVIKTTVYDNPWADAERREPLERLTGIARERWLLGEWVSAEGLVYDQWDRARNIRERDRTEMVRWVVACDAGYRNPFVALLVGVDGDGRMHVAEMIYRTGMQPQECVAAVRDMAAGMSVEAVLVDPSAPAIIDAMRAADLPAMGGNNEVFGGIGMVQQRLADAGDGRPRLTVDPRCQDMIAEFETYRWDVGRNGEKDKPVKEMDHAMDAIRYAVRHVDNTQTVAAAVPRASAVRPARRDPWDDWR